MYREAVNGRLIMQKSKSEMHKDNTNAVVAWLRSFEFLNNATIVIRFPENDMTIKFFISVFLCIIVHKGNGAFCCYIPKIPTTMKTHAQTAAKIVAACGYTTTDGIVMMTEQRIWKEIFIFIWDYCKSNKFSTNWRFHKFLRDRLHK